MSSWLFIIIKTVVKALPTPPSSQPTKQAFVCGRRVVLQQQGHSGLRTYEVAPLSLSLLVKMNGALEELVHCCWWYRKGFFPNPVGKVLGLLCEIWKSIWSMREAVFSSEMVCCLCFLENAFSFR